MLKGKLIHPEILEALGRAGHGSKVLIADGNYPFSTRLGPRATLVSLNLAPGIVSAVQALEALLAAVPVEAAAVMAVAGSRGSTQEPEIWNDFRRLLREAAGREILLEARERFEFYAAASSPDVALTVATGEKRLYANLLLTIGVVPPR